MVQKSTINNSPQLTVLMPAYNAADYISESIESILVQTFKDFIFIILDDASTDNTLEIINRYKRKDKRIKVLKNLSNEYIASCRNILIKNTTTQFIAWQDADDISLPDRLSLQIKYLKNNPSVGIVGGFIEFFDEEGNSSLRKYKEQDQLLRKKIFRYSPVAQPVAMIRRECFDTLGLYNLKYPPAEDIDMSFRIGTKYKFGNIQKVLLKYRVTQTSATYRKLRKMELSTLAVRSKYIFHPSYPLTTIDFLYNLLQFISVFLIPAKLKISLFKKFRNEKN